MVSRNGIRLSAILVGVLLTAACATAPVQEMSDARQAVEAAEVAGARSKATATFAKAQRLLERAERSLERGEYGAARADALKAKRAAIEARKRTRELELEP